MIGSDMEANGRRFLVELYRQTGGDPSAQVSMFAVGEHLGLEREISAKVAEELIGSGFVSVKTLSGGIGISDEGVDRSHRWGCGPKGSEGGGTQHLGDQRVLEEGGRKSVDELTALLKTRTAETGRDFDTLTEIIADLKTIDAQMSSPRPKTAILRECFQSIRDLLEKSGAGPDSLLRINRLLGP